ncbi:GntR family transcriptional regulator [Actinomadura soli]|uniref:GntR family transcriptional regulator n=1 Tax=Actinomadura soli TaxID=2508997 RepID=UPI001486A288|nr:GntR family transcriptional regulator [Actinomadura soli]
MTDDVSREKVSPRWRMVTDHMRTEILDGYYQPGQALPGEAQLASHYATSRPTVRKAIAQLAAEGLLSAAHGRGTFVRPRPDRRLIAIGHDPHPDLLSPEFDVIAAGWEPVDVPSDAEREHSGLGHRVPIPNPCGIAEAETLGIRRGHSVIYRYAFWQHAKVRTRVYIESNIPADLVAGIEPADYYAHLADTRGPLRWTTTVLAQMPSGDEISDLGMEPTGTPLLVVRRIMLAADGRPLEFTQLHAPGDRFEAASATDHEPDTEYTALHL